MLQKLNKDEALFPRTVFDSLINIFKYDVSNWVYNSDEAMRLINLNNIEFKNQNLLYGPMVNFREKIIQTLFKSKLNGGYDPENYLQFDFLLNMGNYRRQAGSRDKLDEKKLCTDALALENRLKLKCYTDDPQQQFSPSYEYDFVCKQLESELVLRKINEAKLKEEVLKGPHGNITGFATDVASAEYRITDLKERKEALLQKLKDSGYVSKSQLIKMKRKKKKFDK